MTFALVSGDDSVIAGSLGTCDTRLRDLTGVEDDAFRAAALAALATSGKLSGSMELALALRTGIVLLAGDDATSELALVLRLNK